MSSNVNGLDFFDVSSPLISFHSIIDEDMSLIKYILKDFRNPSIFDLDRAKNMTYTDIVGELYRRKYENPLYIFAKDGKHDFLDECYREFIDTKEEDILFNGVTTEMFKVVKNFKVSGYINPVILYYTQAQEKVLEEELNDIKRVSIDELNDGGNKRKNVYGQFYFKRLEEVKPFEDLNKKTFYFSSFGLNLNDTNDDLKDNDLILRMIKGENKINIFDMYRMDIIGRYNDEQK